MIDKVFTYLTVRYPGFIKSRLGHEVLWIIFRTSMACKRLMNGHL